MDVGSSRIIFYHTSLVANGVLYMLHSDDPVPRPIACPTLSRLLDWVPNRAQAPRSMCHCMKDSTIIQVINFHANFSRKVFPSPTHQHPYPLLLHTNTHAYLWKNGLVDTIPIVSDGRLIDCNRNNMISMGTL